MLKKFLNKFFKNKEEFFQEESDIKIDVKRDDFNVRGTKDEFTVSFYNNQVEFFTKHGVIIGFRDKRNSNQIFYYGEEGTKDGEN